MLARTRETFGRDKVVDAPALNRLGLQVGRTVAASARLRMTRWSAPAEIDNALLSLRTDGFAVLPRLFTSAVIDEIAEVALRVNADARIAHFTDHPGGNRLEGTWRSDIPEPDRDVLDRFWLHPTVTALLSAAERLDVAPGAGRCTIQRLVQGDGEPDR